jgi:hypothetical protein
MVQKVSIVSKSEFSDYNIATLGKEYRINIIQMAELVREKK